MSAWNSSTTVSNIKEYNSINTEMCAPCGVIIILNCGILFLKQKLIVKNYA